MNRRGFFGTLFGAGAYLALPKPYLLSSVSVKALTDCPSARYTLRTNANGYVVGWSLDAGGSPSNFDIVADKFRILNPGDESSPSQLKIGAV